MPDNTKLIHEILSVGMLQCNCHILGDPRTLEGIVIDPGDDAERIIEIIRRHNLKIRAILITHTHIDHVVGLRKVQQATSAPVYIHPDDLELYRMLDAQAAWIGWKPPEKIEVDQMLREGDSIRWGPYEVDVVHTPGHTPGSVCLYMPSEISGSLTPAAAKPAIPLAEVQPGRLFAGDTLFAGSIGRTNLWGGSFESIIRSVKGKLLELPDDTIVYPGHGESTTIGEERQSNPFLVGN